MGEEEIEVREGDHVMLTGVVTQVRTEGKHNLSVVIEAAQGSPNVMLPASAVQPVTE